MISLKDEIKAFEKLVYNKQLAEFVTVDQMFVGGGITIQSMIHESNFIVEELKKINAVFLNYCKLNEKVYLKMVEHQLGMLNQQTKLNTLTNSIDKKIGDTVKIMKELHQNTVLQNQKSLKALETISQPLKSELEKKVDKTKFETQMKKFLEEYQEGDISTGDSNYSVGNIASTTGQNISEMVQGETNGNRQKQQEFPIIKKAGKVSHDDFFRFQSEIYKRIKQSDGKLSETQVTALSSKEMILKYIPVISSNSSELSSQATEITKLNRLISEQEVNFSANYNKLLQEVNRKTNDQFFKEKFDQFYDRQIKPHMASTQEKFKAFDADVRKNVQQNRAKFNKYEGQFANIHSKFVSASTNIKKHSQDIQSLRLQLKSNNEESNKEKLKNKQNAECLQSLIAKKANELQQKFKLQNDEVRKNLQKLAFNVGESVLKAVDKKNSSTLKVISENIRANSDKIKILKGDVNVINEDIKNIRDILSMKANFTDIIHHVQKKADREDLKGLEVKVNESAQLFISKNLNDNAGLGKIQEKSERVRRSSFRASKTLFGTPSPNKLNKTQLDRSTKLFMCGLLDNSAHIGESRNLLSSNSKRNSLKSAIINDFLF